MNAPQRTTCTTMLLLAAASVLCTACNAPPALFPTPALLIGTDLDSITDDRGRSPDVEVFYATDRVLDPSRTPDPYPPERERFLRLGVAHVRIGSEDMTWADVSRLSTDPDRRQAIPTSLEAVDDYGPHADTTIYFDPITTSPGIEEPKARYAAEINDRLARSRRKTINLYVAPFKVDFDTAVITAAEFHHYLGRDGVFIAYSWPTKTGTLSYLAAVEIAYRTRRLLRIFIEYLATETDAEQINLMTYSAGARVLSGALHQLSLMYSDLATENNPSPPLGQVIFCAPDIDHEAFMEHAAEGIHNLTGQLTVYTNKDDAALKTSRFLYKWKRLGAFETSDMTPQGIELLLELERGSYVSVTNAKDFDRDNGHGYFRKSPFVASDILLMLGHDLPPAQRGLVRAPGDPIWRFPDDYEDRLAEIRDGLGDSH